MGTRSTGNCGPCIPHMPLAAVVHNADAREMPTGRMHGARFRGPFPTCEHTCPPPPSFWNSLYCCPERAMKGGGFVFEDPLASCVAPHVGSSVQPHRSPTPKYSSRAGLAPGFICSECDAAECDGDGPEGLGSWRSKWPVFIHFELSPGVVFVSRARTDQAARSTALATLLGDSGLCTRYKTAACTYSLAAKRERSNVVSDLDCLNRTPAAGRWVGGCRWCAYLGLVGRG